MFGSRSASDELGELKVGYPSICRLDDGNVLVAYWCCENNVFNIRWTRIACRTR